eukprot:757556-Pyramimonas_sp.AAC.1
MHLGDRPRQMSSNQCETSPSEIGASLACIFNDERFPMLGGGAGLKPPCPPCRELETADASCKAPPTA